jgi:hypothetical protein
MILESAVICGGLDLTVLSRPGDVVETRDRGLETAPVENAAYATIKDSWSRKSGVESLSLTSVPSWKSAAVKLACLGVGALWKT